MSVSVMSMVPRQLNDYDEKLAWLKSVVKENRPDIVITPQEYFGGAVMMPHRKWFTKEELLPVLLPFCKKYRLGMVIGVCEALPSQKVQSLWFINERGEFLGSIQKFAHPRYDHVGSQGSGDLTPETDFAKRFVSYTIHGLAVAGVFCWEVYSTVLWAGLSVVKPDLIANCIKFGPNAWPKVEMVKDKDKNEYNTVTGFGYGNWEEEGGWIDRVKFASLWETRCPIISSTNSWNLRPVSMPICGIYTGLPGQGPDNSLWHPLREDKLKEIPEKVLIDVVDQDKIRAIRKNKFSYKQSVGEFPPMSVMKYTMLLKMARIEDRILSKREVRNIPDQVSGSNNLGL